jgi:hypothetical protein
MRCLLDSFLNDERGSLLVRDWVFVATILVLSILPTAVSIRSRMQIPLEASSSNEISAGFSYSIEPGN